MYFLFVSISLDERGANYYMKKPYNLENIISFLRGTKFNIYQI